MKVDSVLFVGGVLLLLAGVMWVSGLPPLPVYGLMRIAIGSFVFACGVLTTNYSILRERKQELAHLHPSVASPPQIAREGKLLKQLHPEQG